MAIALRQVFEVQAPIERVWAFVMDPQQVAACMPGAQLDEVVDERTFHGTIRVKVGAITTSYRGRVQFVSVDERARAVELLAEGRETGGGLAKGTMSSKLESRGNGRTGVAVDASVDVTGRIAQVSRGMIQGVSEQLFQQFVVCAKARLEAPEGAELPAAARVSEPVRILPLILRAIWAAIVRFVRRLFGRRA